MSQKKKLEWKTERDKSCYFICRLVSHGSRKPDNSGRFQRAKQRNMTPFLKRNWGNKEQFVSLLKASLLMETLIEEPRRANQSSLSCCAFMLSQWNLLHPCLSIFLHLPAPTPLLFSPVFTSSLAVNTVCHFYYSLLTLSIPTTRLHFCSVCAATVHLSSSLSTPSICVFSRPPLSCMSGHWSWPLLWQGWCCSH